MNKFKISFFIILFFCLKINTVKSQNDLYFNSFKKIYNDSNINYTLLTEISNKLINIGELNNIDSLIYYGNIGLACVYENTEKQFEALKKYQKALIYSSSKNYFKNRTWLYLSISRKFYVFYCNEKAFEYIVRAERELKNFKKVIQEYRKYENYIIQFKATILLDLNMLKIAKPLIDKLKETQNSDNFKINNLESIYPVTVTLTIHSILLI